MQPGIWQILIVAVVVLILFGRGRISEMMGDFGKGISSFKKGKTEEASAKDTSAKEASKAQIEAPAKDASDAKASEKSDASN